jgi:hypothetical protein
MHVYLVVLVRHSVQLALSAWVMANLRLMLTSALAAVLVQEHVLQALSARVNKVHLKKPCFVIYIKHGFFIRDRLEKS